MTLRLGDIFVNIAKAESKMSSIKTESEGYSNRINDLENRTNADYFKEVLFEEFHIYIIITRIINYNIIRTRTFNGFHVTYNTWKYTFQICSKLFPSKSKNDIINLDDQLTKAKREVEDFKGKLASTKEDMTLRLGDIFVNIM
jgi:hypothetical protein